MFKIRLDYLGLKRLLTTRSSFYLRWPFDFESRAYIKISVFIIFDFRSLSSCQVFRGIFIHGDSEMRLA